MQNKENKTLVSIRFRYRYFNKEAFSFIFFFKMYSKIGKKHTENTQRPTYHIAHQINGLNSTLCQALTRAMFRSANNRLMVSYQLTFVPGPAILLFSLSKVYEFYIIALTSSVCVGQRKIKPRFLLIWRNIHTIIILENSVFLTYPLSPPIFGPVIPGQGVTKFTIN